MYTYYTFVMCFNDDTYMYVCQRALELSSLYIQFRPSRKSLGEFQLIQCTCTLCVSSYIMSSNSQIDNTEINMLACIVIVSI